MGRRFMAAALGAAAMCQPAMAQEVCVQCDGPAVMYRCAIADADKAGQFRGRAKAMEYICITELARQGGHERCRVARDFGNVCLGDQRTLGWSGAREGQVDGADPAAAGPPKAPAEQAKDGPPRTLAEVARNTVEQSKKTAKSAGEQIENAGEAVGGAVKKTWNCLMTLFSAC